MLWFEPERVAPGTWLAENHPEWILGGRQGGLLNFGNPDVSKWVTEHVDQVLVAEGIDLYRQDFNMDPLAYWRAADAKDRQGIAEIRHVTNLLAYWDELKRRHPNMLIDECASGGRRNDLEMMRRAVPMWRSDKTMEPIGQQSMTYGISMWLPYFGTGTVAWGDAAYFITGKSPVESYGFWSSAVPEPESAVRRSGKGARLREDSTAHLAVARSDALLLRRLLSANENQHGTTTSGSPGNSIAPSRATVSCRRSAAAIPFLRLPD